MYGWSFLWKPLSCGNVGVERGARADPFNTVLLGHGGWDEWGGGGQEADIEMGPRRL